MGDSESVQSEKERGNMTEQTSESVSGGDCEVHHIEPVDIGACDMVGWAVLRLSDPCLGATPRWKIAAGLYRNERDALTLIQVTTGRESPAGWRAAYVRVTNNIQWTFEELPDPEQTAKRRRKLADALAVIAGELGNGEAVAIARVIDSRMIQIKVEQTLPFDGLVEKAICFSGGKVERARALGDLLMSGLDDCRRAILRRVTPECGSSRRRAFEGMPRMAFDNLKARFATLETCGSPVNFAASDGDMPQHPELGMLIQLGFDFGKFHRFDVVLWDGSKWVPYAIAKTTEYKCENCGHQFRQFVASVLSANHESLSCEQCGDHDVRQLPPSASSETRGSSVAAD